MAWQPLGPNGRSLTADRSLLRLGWRADEVLLLLEQELSHGYAGRPPPRGRC
jgi:hypothetical protein